MTATTTATVEKKSVKETAAAMRKALKEAFPGTKFSVRMSTGTAYGWIRVSWLDGPTRDQVAEVTVEFQSAQFDGMIDGYEYWVNPGGWSCVGVNFDHDYSREVLDDAISKIQHDDLGLPYIDADGVRYFATYPSMSDEMVACYWLHEVALDKAGE